MQQTAIQQGGAQALPMARAFIAAGGRILIDPQGKVATALDAERIFGAADPQQARRGFTIGRRFHRRLRNARFARSVACLVATEGKRTANGWLVMHREA